MRTLLKIFILTITTISFSGIGMAQDAVSASDSKFVKETIHVDGVCNACKKRIEKAARVKGVKQAVWYKAEDELVVIYNKDKTSRTEICQSVASIGHDTDEIKAEEAVYKSLPGCCQYKEVADH